MIPSHAHQVVSNTCPTSSILFAKHGWVGCKQALSGNYELPSVANQKPQNKRLSSMSRSASCFDTEQLISKAYLLGLLPQFFGCIQLIETLVHTLTQHHWLQCSPVIKFWRCGCHRSPVEDSRGKCLSFASSYSDRHWVSGSVRETDCPDVHFIWWSWTVP
jgi:hypothetical protein